MMRPAPSSSRLALAWSTESPLRPGTVTKTFSSTTLAESVFCRKRSELLLQQGFGRVKARSCCNNSSLLFLQKRSEEHTSELQSHLNLVCRLLLEKKKNSG